MNNRDIIQLLKDENNFRFNTELAKLLDCSKQALVDFENYKRTDDIETLLLSSLLSAGSETDIKDVILDVLLNADNNVKQRMIQLALSKRIGKDSP